MLLCRSAGRLCALPLEHVVETMRPLPIVPLPATIDLVPGLAVIRGVPVPVLDLGGLLGQTEPCAAARLVTLRLPGRQVALAVEEVLGVRELPRTPAALPPLLASTPGQAVTAIGRLDAEVLLVLQTARLVPDAVWTALAGAREP